MCVPWWQEFFLNPEYICSICVEILGKWKPDWLIWFALMWSNVLLCVSPSEAVPRCHAVQWRVSQSWRRKPAILPATGGGGGGDLWQHGRHQRPPSPLQTWRPRLHPSWLQQGNTHKLKRICCSRCSYSFLIIICVCVWVEADGVPGPDSEDLLCDSSEHVSGAPPSGPHWPVLTADGEYWTVCVFMVWGFS